MKRPTILSVLIAIGLVFGLAATTITVGNIGETTRHFPIDTAWDNNETQQIYKHYQINCQGEVSKIRFFYNSTYRGSLNYCHNWSIYMGNVTRSHFASIDDWVPHTNLTNVFSGSVLEYFPSPGEWMEIPLQTPFVYDNDYNLLVAIYDNTPGKTDYLFWGGFVSDYNTGFITVYDNEYNPNGPGIVEMLTNRIAAIQLVFPDTEAPMAPTLIYPANGATVIEGRALDWALPDGSADAIGYDVYIDDVLVSENQASHKYTLSGLEVGIHTWQIVARNAFGSSLASETRTFEIVPGRVIGNGNIRDRVPIFAGGNYSYSQSIYLQSDLGRDVHRIEKIAYYWNGGARGDNSNDWVIYMGHTDKTEFSDASDWVPTSEMVQVFNGKLDIPVFQGWVEIVLDIPFVYNNIDNLVIAIDETTPGGDGGHVYFRSTSCPGQMRSISHYHSYCMPLPDIPPDGIPVYGYPNILMEFGALPSSPVLKATPDNLNFGKVIEDDTSDPLFVKAYNAGSGSLNLAASDISITGPDAAAFLFDPVDLPVTLEPGQFVNIPISVTGANAGDISATLRLVYNGENCDVALNAEVLPPTNVIIGAGYLAQPYPFGTGWGYQGSVALYTADEIKAIGKIDNLAWDCVGTTSREIPYKIWVKNTNASKISDVDWTELIADMTLVKQGVYRPTTTGWHSFPPDTPFAYTGQNLIVAVWTDQRGYGSLSGLMNTYTVVDARRHQHYWSVPTGDWLTSNQLPNIMMHLSPVQQKDIAAINISSEPTLNLNITSNFIVSVRNNGSDVLTDYSVKLKDSNGVELASVNGPPIDSGAIVEVALSWTPVTLGAMEICGKVEMAGDEVAQNNLTETIEIYVHSEGTQTTTIGAGDELACVPLDFDGSSSLYQCIYLDSELGFGSGTISALAIYNHFEISKSDAPIRVYLGSTEQESLSDGFVSANDLTLVYEGNITCPVGENAILIPLQTHFTHTGGNLVMAFQRLWEGIGPSGLTYFKCQSIDGDRAAIPMYADAEFGPDITPEASIVDKTPQTTFYFIADHDLMATSITGNPTPVLGETSSYTIRIKNTGFVDQTDYIVKLMGPDDVVLGCATGGPINSMQSLDVVIPWTPETLGSTVIYGKVEADCDEVAMNNCTAGMEINVYPVGVTGVTAAVTDDGDEVEIAWCVSEPEAKAPLSFAAQKASSRGAGADTDQLVREGFMVYRLQAGEEQDEAVWTALTETEIQSDSFRDKIWFALPGGDYLWAVKAVYEGGVASLPGFSGVLSRDIQNGTIVGRVKSKLDVAIAGATICNGYLSAKTSPAGKYTLLVPAGTHKVTASAPGFADQTVQNVTVNPDLSTTIDFILLAEGANDPQIPPVLATALHGNYPNPFNPQTTISYSVKESGRVRLQIYNIRGQLVRTLIDEEQLTGHYKQLFDGKDNRGRRIASGVYLLRMIAPGYQKGSKMVLIQ